MAFSESIGGEICYVNNNNNNNSNNNIDNNINGINDMTSPILQQSLTSSTLLSSSSSSTLSFLSSLQRINLQMTRICKLFFPQMFNEFNLLSFCNFYCKKNSKLKPRLNHGDWTFSLFLLLLIMTVLLPNSTDSCQFPSHWNGIWFQKGVPDPIRISYGNISEKGLCRESNGEKFLIENRNDKCFRCMVINERHNNLLQYKETYQCHSLDRRGRISLESICSEINGDAPLFSLFRLDAKPVTCPFLGPFEFSYSRGQGECKDPLSMIETCTDDSHLKFKFQACADVYGSEHRDEVLECFADWKEGSYRYLVGKLYYKSAKTDEDKFRCFVFDKIKDETEGYEIAQSGDATCDGLLSPKDGSRTMKIRRTNEVRSRCKFPSWVTSKKNWKSLDASHMYEFNNQLNNSFLVYNSTDGKVVRHGICIDEEVVTVNDAFNVSQYVIYLKSGCTSKYVCVRIYKRAKQIIEIIFGNQLTNTVNDVCSFSEPNPTSSSSSSSTSSLPYSDYHTLTTKTTETQECPFQGIYAVNVPGGPNRPISPSSEKTLFTCSEQSLFNSKCNSNDHMQLQSRCSFKDTTRNFRCLGGWNENGTNYLIASSNEDGIRQYCLVYRESEDGLQMTISSATCVRNIINQSNSQKESHMALKLTSKGECSSSYLKSSSVHIIRISFVLKQLISIHIGLLLFYVF